MIPVNWPKAALMLICIFSSCIWAQTQGILSKHTPKLLGVCVCMVVKLSIFRISQREGFLDPSSAHVIFAFVGICVTSHLCKPHWNEQEPCKNCIILGMEKQVREQNEWSQLGLIAYTLWEFLWESSQRPVVTAKGHRGFFQISVPEGGLKSLVCFLMGLGGGGGINNERWNFDWWIKPINNILWSNSKYSHS